MNRILITLAFFLFLIPTDAREPDGRAIGNFFKASGTPVNPKVQISWNRYYTNEGLHEIYKQLESAHPHLLRLGTIGQSFEGRELWLLTVTNLDNKPHQEKPAFWIDGNIHANEIQTAEVSVYTAWYLVENYGKNDFITNLLDEKVFYILPVMNPDGREYYMNQPNTMSSPRSGTIPLDDDGDGMVGEDGFDDLNGDGHITQMRRRNPYGNWKTDPNDPRRMVQAGRGEFGEWELLGWEGIDRDGDGRLNEDQDVGYYDPNRDWGWNWQPDYVQRGAYLYPFSLPETRAVRDFVIAHPNIAGSITHHNTGGMLLRGPGAAEDAQYYLPQDVRVYDALGELGEKIIPGYDYLVLYQDLYTVYGGQIDWFHMMRGIFTFTSEMFSRYYLFHEKQRGWGGGFAEDFFTFDRYLLFEDAFVPWEDYDHPQFGAIQIGGFKKNYIRNNPGFLLEQELHRLTAFTLFHAYHTPKLEIVELTSEDLGGGQREVTAVIANTRLIPTHAGIDLRFNIERPNYISLEGAEVLAGMRVINRDLNVVEEQQHNPAVIEVDNIPGMGTVTVKWIVHGRGSLSVKVDSAKGGVVRRSL
ncbi:MAG: peptidase M14 [Bacteroidia bacterium]|nr:MAG: peptidase M14 [Bacteroidia bacterium]